MELDRKLFRKSGFAGWVEANWDGLKIIVPLVAGFSLLAGLILLFTWTEERSCRVKSRSWACAIEVERFRPVRDGSWYYSVPGDAYDKNCYTKQSGTRRVKTGESCTTITSGSGKKRSSRRSCTPTYIYYPVFDTWCDYTVDRWRHERTVTSTGPGTQEVTWPDPRLVDNERIASNGRSAAYALDFTDTLKGNSFHCNVREGVYRQFKEGSLLRVDVGVVTGNPWCDSIIAISEMEE